VAEIAAAERITLTDGSTMSEQPWYHAGLRFKCTGCGDCCTGAPGYVWVNRDEIAALAARLEDGRGRFRGPIRSLGRNPQEPGGVRQRRLPFSWIPRHESARCITSAPRQCKTWPFWESNVRTPEAWKEPAKSAPGSGKGPVVPTGEHQRPTSCDSPLSKLGISIRGVLPRC